MTSRQELETKLAVFAAAQSPVLPISYENVSFTRPTTGLWLECYFMSGPTIIATLDASTNRERGTWVVNCWGLSGQGVGQLDALVAKVISTFKVLPKVGTVSIEAPGSNSKMNLTNDGWACISVSFPYRVESLA